jgi:hypothetical protein
MKVVTQLVQHFWQRGALTREEIEYLLEHDFIRADDLPGYQPSKAFTDGSLDSFDNGRVELPDPLEEIQEELIRRRPERRQSRVETRTGELDIDDILERLRQDFDRRETDFDSVLALGKKFANVETWCQAASELRSVSSAQFHEGLCANLRDGFVLLGDLWQASDPEPFHRLVADSETRGRAARSFLALLVANVPEELGKYSWLLKYDEMQSVVNLRVLHDRVLASLGNLHREDRVLLAHALADNSDQIQVWALVVLYNAHRELPPRLGEEPRYGKEYGPVFLPDLETWKQAWTSALRMDRKKVTKLLVGCCQQACKKSQSSEQLIEVADFSFVPLMCPVGWHLP